jgi:hypothetical protein
MKIIDLIRLVENRLTTLNTSLATAFSRGDYELVAKLEQEILEVEQTLYILRNNTASE